MAQAAPEARRAIMRALALDSSSAEAYAALGYLQKSYDWNWKAAEASYDRALALDPNAAGTWQWYGELLETMDRHDDAGRAFERAVALDPVSPVAQMALGAHLVTVDQRDAGRAAFEASLELQPRLWPALLQLMFMEMEDGHIAKAADYARRAAPLLGFDADEAGSMVTKPDAAHRAAAAATLQEWMDQGKLPALAGASWLSLLGASDPASRGTAGHGEGARTVQLLHPMVAFPGRAGKRSTHGSDTVEHHRKQQHRDPVNAVGAVAQARSPGHRRGPPAFRRRRLHPRWARPVPRRTRSRLPQLPRRHRRRLAHPLCRGHRDGADRPISHRCEGGSRRTWTFNGDPAPAVTGCIDFDLGFTPATNILSIRRIALPVGAEAEVTVAWLPSLDAKALQPLRQVYHRIADDHYRYSCPDLPFDSTLRVNADGFVLDYPPLWEAA